MQRECSYTISPLSDWPAQMRSWGLNVILIAFVAAIVVQCITWLFNWCVYGMQPYGRKEYVDVASLKEQEIEEGSTEAKLTRDMEKGDEGEPERKRVATYTRRSALWELQRQTLVHTAILSGPLGPCPDSLTFHPPMFCVFVFGFALVALIEYFDVDIIGRLPKALVYDDVASTAEGVKETGKAGGERMEKQPLIEV